MTPRRRLSLLLRPAATPAFPLTVLLAVLASAPAVGIVPPHDTAVAPGREAMIETLARVHQVAAEPAQARSLVASDAAFTAFVAEAGGSWTVRHDLRTGAPSLIQGSGIPWIPGRGNELTWSDLGLSSEKPSEAEILGLLEARARGLVGRHPDLLDVPTGVDLRVSSQASRRVDGGRIRSMSFHAWKDGVRVSDALVTFRLSHGNLVQFGAARLGGALASAETRALVDADGALEATLADLGRAFTPLPGPEESDVAAPAGPAELVDPPELFLLPWAKDPRHHEGEVGAGLDYRLAWRLVLRIAGGHETWVSWRDARTGARIALFDLNRYACPQPAQPRGRVTGGVWLGPVEEVEESLRGLPFALVANGGDVISDYQGGFPLDPNEPASTGLNGRFFDTDCTDCSNPAQPLAIATGGGQLSLGFGGVDELGNGLSTRADRNAYYHLNVVRQLASRNLDDAATGGFLSRNIRTTVNIDSSCNAFFDGNGVNFFRSSGRCNNTGEIADVMQHEWGHALDFATLLDPGNFEGARSEGLSDVVAFLSTHDPRLGPYFVRGNAGGIRNADEAVSGRGTLTAGNVGDECPGGGGALGYEVHCEGEIFSQANWHLGVNLRAKYGERGGWFTLERLFFQSLPLSDAYVPDQTDSAYDAYILVDDDDGNLANGTPNAAEINDAFSHHEIASDPLVVDSPECAPPAAPPLTLEKLTDPLTERAQVRVSWPAVAGAVQYEVSRNDAGGVGADVPIALILPPVTEYFDDDVTEGVTYRYRVTVYDATGCFSVDDNESAVDVDPVARFAVVGYRVDDTASGNGNGIVDPGETFTLSLDVRATAGDATAVTATLVTAEPGVSLPQPTASFGDIAIGETAASADPHASIAISAAVECGRVLVFDVDVEAPEGCTRDRLAIPIGVSDFEVQLLDEFETDSGWVVDPDGTDDATTGIWTREDPNGTAAQPGEDTTVDGSRAWVTGNAGGGGAGADDVDDGCTTLLSPEYDLGGTAGLFLRYQRFFSIATSFDDELAIDLSNDGGGSWLPLERLDSPTGGWQEALFELDTVLGEPADRLVMRIIACDQGAGSLLEAGLDDFSVGRTVFECESAGARPRLRLLPVVVGDDAAFGGLGNGNGTVEPGETVRIVLDVENFGNAAAENVTATAVLLDAPAAVMLTDDATAWVDVGPFAVERSGAEAPPHFEIVLPRPGVACEGGIRLGFSITYEGGPDGPYELPGEVALPIGVPGGGPIQEIVYAEDFEAGEAGWTHVQVAGQDDWHFGPPSTDPGAMSEWDPTAAASGINVWGNDLGGNRGGQDWNGNYRANVSNYLESPSIDCSALVGTRLSFQRWLTVEAGEFDQATIEVNGVEVWRNPVGADLIDTEWTAQDVDISAVADGNPDVRIRFTLTTDGGLQYGGWTLDDVQVASRANSCEGARGCESLPEPPPAGPVLRATGVADDDGAEFSWTAATPAPGEHFRLYRGTTPESIDELVTPGDYRDPAFDDRTAPGPLYFYLLRLADCDGVEGP